MIEWKRMTHPLIMPYAGNPRRVESDPVIYYNVIYRTGRPDSFKWHELIGTYRIDKATEIADGLRDRRFKAEIIPSGIFEAKGLPKSYNAHDFYRSP